MNMSRRGFLGGAAASFFTGAYADEANRYLEGEYHNGWELGV